ncbi:lipid droplet-associated protein [Rhodococcus sp. X156]|uniref:lipid droplet-associated protein n=1 Tax=Rhodococcus sp. X156 TaxID=2499145 RepID=UPI000FD7DFA2|nr:lipid droplet-associated protein [Rhodococcus sp. X156]
MPRIPLAVRVAAGLAAATATEVRNLPSTVVSLPVTAVSQVLQNLMRVQQQVTALAIRGDEVLSFLHPAQEKPEWATFDEPIQRPEAPSESVRRSGNGRFALYSNVPVDATTADSDDTEESGSAVGAEEPVSGYDTMTLAQLRARLRTLTLVELEALLAYEQAQRARAPYLTMLDNRISTVNAQ